MFTQHVGDLAESTRKLASLRWKKIQVRIIDAGSTVALVSIAVLAGIALAIAATLKVVAGLDHALARWSGEGWVGELGAGVFWLAALFLAVRFVRARARRAVLEDAPRPRSDPEAAGVPPFLNGAASHGAPLVSPVPSEPSPPPV